MPDWKPRSLIEADPKHWQQLAQFLRVNANTEQNENAKANLLQQAGECDQHIADLEAMAQSMLVRLTHTNAERH